MLLGYLFGFVLQKSLPEESAGTSAAYVNLMANCMDNFTHGLAIAGAFVIDRSMGITTTMSILIHEVRFNFVYVVYVFKLYLDSA